MKIKINTHHTMPIVQFIRSVKPMIQEQSGDDTIDFMNIIAFPERIHPSIHIYQSPNIADGMVGVQCTETLDMDEDTVVNMLIYGTKWSGDTYGYHKVESSINGLKSYYNISEAWICDVFHRPSWLIFVKTFDYADGVVLDDIRRIRVNERIVKERLSKERIDLQLIVNSAEREIKRLRKLSFSRLRHPKKNARQIASLTERIHDITGTIAYLDTAFDVIVSDAPMDADQYKRVTDAIRHFKGLLTGYSYGDKRIFRMFHNAKDALVEGNGHHTYGLEIVKEQRKRAYLEYIIKELEGSLQ